MTHTELIPADAVAVTPDPVEVVQRATRIATALAEVIRKQKLYRVISGRNFVVCEGWTTCAAMNNVMPHEVEVTEKDGVFTAVVELRRLSDGMAVGRASAECGAPDELDRHGKPLWSARARYARRSMALTRATSKACRMAFSWIIALAGYEVTPAEEVPDGGFADEKQPEKPETAELTKASDAEQKTVFEDAFRAKVTRETFPEFYQSVIGRKWDGTLYAEDVKALLAECGKRIASKGKAGKPVAEGSAA